MINTKYLQLIRSYRKLDVNNFIYDVLAKRIIDSLDLLSIEIDQALEIGINDNIVYNYLNNKFINSNIDRADVCLSKNNINENSNFYKIQIDNLDFKSNYYKLIYSNLFLHLTNSFEKSLGNIFSSLCSNGLFIAVIPSKNSMFQLLNSMYETDLYFYNGAFQRFNPTLEIDSILPILKGINFDTPSIHTDTVTINYKVFSKLLRDVRDMKLSYSYNDKKQNFENKNYFRKLEDIYKKKYFNNNYILEIKVNIVSAWKK